MSPRPHFLGGGRSTATDPDTYTDTDTQHPSLLAAMRSSTAQTDLDPALRAHWQAGYDQAEYTHYITGWQAGLVLGLVAGTLLGATGLWLALQIGMWAGKS